MTVVIMSLLWDGQKGQPRNLFGACDMLLSAGQASTTLAYGKIHRIHKTWLLGYSGFPAPFMPILNAVTTATTPDTAQTDMIAAVKKAYQDYRQREVADRVLSPFGMDMAAFRAEGLATFGTHKFSELCDQIDSFDLGISLLLGGWSPKALYDPRLATISNPGVAYDSSSLGVGAIGAGADIALGHLYAVHSIRDTEEHALYRILEAKLMSEAARSVGPETVLLNIDGEGEMHAVSDEAMEAFRQAWTKRRRAVPKAISALLNEPEN